MSDWDDYGYDDDEGDDEADYCYEHDCHIEDCADEHEDEITEDDDDVEDGEETGESCYGCQRPNATTSYMEQPFCWPCYQAASSGNSQVRDRCHFADPGGNSALRAAVPGNPRIYPCPNCKSPNRLTSQDRARGYQCDSCADRAERGGDY